MPRSGSGGEWPMGVLHMLRRLALICSFESCGWAKKANDHGINDARPEAWGGLGHWVVLVTPSRAFLRTLWAPREER